MRHNFQDDLLPGLLLISHRKRGGHETREKKERRDRLKKYSEKRERGEDGQGMGENSRSEVWRTRGKIRKRLGEV